MIALPREHLLCPSRQRSSWADTEGGSDEATWRPPGQCPLLSPLHAAPHGGPRVSAGFQPSGKPARWCSEIPEARGARETAQRQLAAFISTPPQSDAPCAQKQVSSAGV